MSDVRLSESLPLVEAASGTPTKRRFRARLIQGDIQGSSGYYAAEMLRRDGPTVFREGLQVYLDHPTNTEASDRPERSVRDLAGRLASTAVYENDGLYADIEVYPHVAPVIEAMADDIGMSIRAAGTCEASTDQRIPGPLITSLTEAMSVDFVTRAGAGGAIVQLLESARAQQQAPAPEADTTPDAPPPAQPTQEGAPMTGSTQGAPPNGGAPTEISEADRLRTENTDLKNQLAEAKLQIAQLGDNARDLAEAQTALEDAKRENLRLKANDAARAKAIETLADSTLPKVAHEEVIEAVTGPNVPLNDEGALDEARLVEAIRAAIEKERRYLARFAEAEGMGSVRGLGESGDGPSREQITDSLAEAFKDLGLGDAQARIAVNGRGR